MPLPQFSTPVVRREHKKGKDVDPDDIHQQMVRWLADFLTEPLSKVFDIFLTTAVVPTDWRHYMPNA